MITNRVLPPNTEEMNPETGIRTTITYHLDENNKMVRTTRRCIRITKQERVLKRVAERRKWAKFGDAVNDTHITRFDNQRIRLHLDGEVHDGEDYVVDDTPLPTPIPKTKPKRVEKSKRRPPDDSPTIKISNISLYADQNSIRKLFSRFGSIARVNVATDRKTGQHRGFAFVSFRAKDSATRAIAAMNGYGCDNMILSVEWAKSAAQCQKEREAREGK